MDLLVLRRRTPRAEGRLTVEQAQTRLAAAGAGELARAHIDLGVALGEAGRADEAVEHYEAAIALDDPDQTPRALRNLGGHLARSGQLDAARTAFHRAIGLHHPLWSRWAAHHLVNVELRDGGGVEAAVAVLQSLDSWRDSPPSAVELWLRGRLRLLLGDTDDAVRLLRSAVAHGGRFADVAARALAEIYYDRADHRTAARFARRAVDLYEDDHDLAGAARAEVLLGEILLAHNEVEAAKRAFQRAMDYPPVAAHATARFRLAWLVLQEAEWIAAPRTQRRMVQKAITLFDQLGDQETPWILANSRLGRARALELLQQPEAARAEYCAAIDFASPATRANFMLRYAEFLVRIRSFDDALVLADALAGDASPALAEIAEKLRADITRRSPR